MALRFSCLGALVNPAVTPFTHGITNQSTGALTAPNEWFFNMREALSAGCHPHGSTLYLTAAPGSTFMILASSSGVTTADVFCSLTHSIVR